MPPVCCFARWGGVCQVRVKVWGAGRRFKMIFDDAQVDFAVKAQAAFGGDPVFLTGEGEFLLIGCGGARRAVSTPQRNRSGAVYPGSFMTAERSLTVWACPCVVP